MLTIFLETYDGEQYTLPNLLKWQLTYTGSVPCDSMQVVCPYHKDMASVLPRAVRFSAVRESEILLRGVVDSYDITIASRGALLTVEGRGMAALLLDNESEAITYEKASLQDILQHHVEPYGLAVRRGSSISGSNYAVTSGSSQWKALRGFTHRFGRYDPYFHRDGTLVIQPLWGSGNLLPVHENTPLISLQQKEDRYGVISEMLIQDKVQGIRHHVRNQAFLDRGGQRRHVLYMPRSTADQRRYTGEYQIAQSALEQFELTISFPFPFAAFPGDRLEVALEKWNIFGTYDVVESCSRMDASGATTEVTASVR